MDAAQEILSQRLTLLIAALLFSLLLSGILRPKAPYLMLNRFILALSNKLNRSRRSTGTRVYRGMILLLFMVVSAYGMAILLDTAIDVTAWMLLAQIAVMAYLIPTKHLRDEVAELSRAVRRDEMPRARGLANALARREHDRLDGSGLLRVGIEYLAENWNDKIIAPAFWYLLLGLPGLFVLRVVNLLDHLIGHRSKEYIAFGWATAKLDDLLQYIPARVAGLLLVAASCFIPKGQPTTAITTILRQSGDTSSPNSGWPLAAMAGAITVSLCGPRSHQGAIIKDAWIGGGSARITRSDMQRAQLLYAVAVLLLLLICASILAVLSGTTFSAIEAL